jgi:hypothetical protein
MSGHRFFEDWKKAPWRIPDPGDGAALPTGKTGMIPLVIAAGASETNTLGRPVQEGLRLFLVAATVGSGGSRVVTVTGGINMSADATITFDAEGETAELVSVPTSTAGTFRWMQMGPYYGT